MATEQNVLLTPVHWQRTRNVGTVPIPALGLVQVVDVDLDGSLQVQAPTGDSLPDLLVNGFTDLPVGAWGQAHNTFPAVVICDDSAGTPVNGQIWGSAAGSFLLTAGKTGYLIAGPGPTGMANVQPLFSTGDSPAPQTFFPYHTPGGTVALLPTGGLPGVILTGTLATTFTALQVPPVPAAPLTINITSIGALPGGVTFTSISTGTFPGGVPVSFFFFTLTGTFTGSTTFSGTATGTFPPGTAGSFTLVSTGTTSTGQTFNFTITGTLTGASGSYTIPVTITATFPTVVPGSFSFTFSGSPGIAPYTTLLIVNNTTAIQTFTYSNSGAPGTFNFSTGLDLNLPSGGQLPIKIHDTGIVSELFSFTTTSSNLPAVTLSTGTGGTYTITTLKVPTVVQQTGTLSSPITYTLPALTSTYPGQTVTVVDTSGTVTGTNTLTVVPASGTINGGVSVVLTAPYGILTFVSPGPTATNWDAITQVPASTTPTGVASVSNSDGTLTISPVAGAVVASLALAHVNGWSGQQYFSQASLTDASPITWNLSTQQAAHVLLTAAIGGTRQLQNPSNMKAGGSYTLLVVQSSTGTNALTYDSAYKWPGGTAPTLSTANNAVDLLTFVSDGTSLFGTFCKAFA